MNLRELQREAHAIAKEKGCWDEERSFGDLIADVHLALSRALEAYRDPRFGTKPGEVPSPFSVAHPDPSHYEFWVEAEGHPIGVAPALAEVVIRVADMAEWYGYILIIHDGLSLVGVPNTFGEWIAMIHCHLSEAWIGPEYIHEQELSGAVLATWRMAERYGIDLDAAIKAKLEYKRSRPHRHGGKAL